MKTKKGKLKMPMDKMTIGTKVNYHSIIDGPITNSEVVIRGEPWELYPGQWVVLLKGKSGAVAVEAISEQAEAK